MVNLKRSIILILTRESIDDDSTQSLESRVCWTTQHKSSKILVECSIKSINFSNFDSSLESVRPRDIYSRRSKNRMFNWKLYIFLNLTRESIDGDNWQLTTVYNQSQTTLESQRLSGLGPPIICFSRFLDFFCPNSRSWAVFWKKADLADFRGK